MKKYLALIVALTMVAAVTTYAKDIRRVMAEKTMTAVTPSATSYIMASYSTATGWDLRRMSDTSVVKLGGMDTTAADGSRYVKPYNSVAFSGTPEEGMLQTTPTGLQIYLGGVWGEVAGSPAPIGIADLTDWPTDVSSAEVNFLNGVTGPIQDQIDAAVTGNSGYVTAPTFSNQSCTVGQWSTAGGYHYDCIATNTWDRYAVTYANWTNVAAADINSAVKVAGPIAAGQINPPDSSNSYYYYTPVVAGSTGSLGYAHWNMYKNGSPNASTSRFAIYDTTGAMVCQSGMVAGDNGQPQTIDGVALTGCDVTAGTTYLVGICTNSDGDTANGPYVANTTPGTLNRIQIPCDGSSFTPGNATELNAVRPIYAWGDNSATR